MKKLDLPKPLIDYSLSDNTESLDLKHILIAQEGKFSNSIHNRLNNHDSAIGNISLFKIFATLVPPLIIVIIIVIVCFLIKTKKIGQLVALTSLVKKTEAYPISPNKIDMQPGILDAMFDWLVVAILILIVLYWILKHYNFLRKLINTVSLPFTECIITRKSSDLNLILYLRNAKTYCYLFIDTLDFCMPDDITITSQDSNVIKIIIHNSCLSSYITLSNKMQVVIKNNTTQAFDLPEALAVPLIQRFTIKSILSSHYTASILIGSNNIYRQHDIIIAPIHNYESIENETEE